MIVKHCILEDRNDGGKYMATQLQAKITMGFPKRIAVFSQHSPHVGEGNKKWKNVKGLI